MPKMDDGTLKALIDARRGTSSINSTQSDASARREALRFYRGDPLGNEEPGMSQVVSRDTMEAVESMLPGLLRPFVAGDETVKFDPTGPEDEDAAKQATEYINYLFHSKNRGFKLLYDAMKDGLLLRQGVWKAVWEKDEKKVAEDYSGIDEMQLQMLEAEPGIEVSNIVQAMDTGLYSAHLVRTIPTGEVKVSVVPPDEFEFERQLADMDSGTFFGHRCRRTVADLIDMGLPKAKCLDLSDDDDGSYISSSERADRFSDEGGTGGSSGEVDALSRYVWIAERYILCDYDGDGAVEWRRVYQGGSGDTILLNEVCDGHPFAAWTPIPITHKLVGMSVHDEVRDIQLVKTGIMREVQNGIYLANRPQREVVDGQVNIDDLLVPKIGGLVRVKQMGQVANLSSTFDLGGSMSLIEYWDGVRESRTGSTRYNQGQDANSLNKTATGISLISNASHAREELMSRQFAEGLKDLFRRILKLVCTHQDKAATIRLRGQWVEMDPREWSDEYDMSVTVGLGTNSAQQQTQMLTGLLQLQGQALQLPGGAAMVTPENIYNTGRRLIEAMGLKGAEKYITDPASAPPQPPQPNPQAEAEQARQQDDQHRAAAQMVLDKHNADQNRNLDWRKALLVAETAENVARIGAEGRAVVAGVSAPHELIAAVGYPGADDDNAPDDSDGPDDEAQLQDGQEAAQEPQQSDAGPQVTPDMVAALQAHFSGQGDPAAMGAPPVAPQTGPAPPEASIV